MYRDIYSQAEQLNKKHRRKRTWYKILSVPICLVVFVTTYALILPAITMESTPDTYCGKAEHVHTDACYDGDNLICGLVTGIVHQHTADCVISVPATEPQGLVCTVEEHKHTEACFMNPEDEASSGETGDDVPADKTPASAIRKPTPLRSSTATTPLTKTLLMNPPRKWRCSPSISSSTSTQTTITIQKPSWRAPSSC